MSAAESSPQKSLPPAPPSQPLPYQYSAPSYDDDPTEVAGYNSVLRTERKVERMDDEWRFDPASGMYWSDKQSLYLDAETGQYYDPESQQYYDPSTGMWTPAVF